MTTLPEALRLADELDHGVGTIDRVRHETAAELRRLHELNVDKTEIIAAISAQRDALLKACRAMLTHMGMDEDEWNKPTFDQARAAIKSVEEGK